MEGYCTVPGHNLSLGPRRSEAAAYLVCTIYRTVKGKSRPPSQTDRRKSATPIVTVCKCCVLSRYRTDSYRGLCGTLRSITSETRRERQIAQIYSIAYIAPAGLSFIGVGADQTHQSPQTHYYTQRTRCTYSIVVAVPNLEQRPTDDSDRTFI